MKKTFKVIMLPTEKTSNLHLASPNDEIGDNYEEKNGKLVPLTANKLLYTDEATEYGFPPQHLYILSDDEIKEGDWYYNSVFNTIEQLQYQKNQNTLTSFDKKIVATTDSSLEIEGSFNNDNSKLRVSNWGGGFAKLPQIPESFIQAYIKAHNEGKPITEVDLEVLECERHEECNGDFNTKCSGINIKTRPDNTVIVHQSKIYTRKEVISLLKEIHEDSLQPDDGFFKQYNSFEDWINKNLK